jgi:hypothetical protein
MDADPQDTPTPTRPAERIDGLSRVLASAGLGLAALGLIEVFGTIAVGLAVKTQRLSFPHRQGYAFLTQLEKSPLSLLLVLAAVFGAITALRPEADRRSARLATIGLWVVVAAGALVGLGSILAVLARFRVAELATSQPIDAITRRVLFTFVVRNFGAAVLALLIAFGALFGPTPKPVVVD